MFMQKIRKSTYKHRKVLVVVIALLCVGLVGSFAIWNSDSVSGSGGDTAVSAAQQVESYEKYIDENKPAQISDADYAAATNMGSMYVQLSQFCVQAYSETVASDSAAAAGYNERAKTAAATAAEYYQQAIDQAPDTMNEAAMAQLYSNRATSLFYAGQNDAARTQFEEALLLAPESYSVASSYADFIYSVDGLAAVTTYLNEYMAGYEEDSDNYKQAAEQLKYYQFLSDVYKLDGGGAAAQ